jgi:ABC-2 type transport system permease protein
MTRFLEDLWLLLTLRAQVAWNGFTGRSLSRKLVLVLVTLVIGGGTIAGTGGIGYALGRVLSRFPELGLESLLPGLILTVAALLILVVSFGVALGSLFLSGDLDLLMTAPVDERAVFVSKVLGGMGLYYLILGAAAVPALVMYGVALGYGPLYYVLALLAVAGTPLLPAGIGALLVMVVARFAPARRVREVLGLVVALTGMSCSIAGQTARAWTRQLGAVGADPRALLDQVRAVVALPVPSFVAGRGLVAAGGGDASGALAGLSGFLVLTFGLFAGSIVLADAMYATGWVRMQSSSAARRGRERAAREAAREGLLGRAPAFAAIALKDWRVIPRDLRNFAQLLAPLLILPALYINLLSGGSSRRPSPLEAAERWANGAVDLQGVVVASGVLLACTLVCGRVAATAISREGQSWWLLKASPLSGMEILVGKLTVVAVPFVLLSTVLMAVAALWNRFSVTGALYGWFGVQVVGLAVLAVYVACGVPWARLDWDDPRRMTSGWTNLASFFATLVVYLLVGALLCLPLLAQAFVPRLATTAWVFGGGAALAVAAGTGALALQFGVSRLPNVGEA